MRWKEKGSEEMRRKEKRREEIRSEVTWNEVKRSEVKVFVAWVQHLFTVTYEWHCTVCGSTVCTFVLKLFAVCHSSCVMLPSTEVVITLCVVVLLFHMLCILFRVFCDMCLFSLCTLLFLPSAVNNIEPRPVPSFYWFI